MTATLKILIADDSLTYRMTIKELLEDNEYEVMDAQDGQIALDLIKEHPPDLAILDVVMPNLDGISVCKFIKQNDQTSSIPIIMLTAKDEIDDKLEGLDSGADEYLTKPFNEEELLVKIQSLLRYKTLQGQLGEDYLHKSILVLSDQLERLREPLESLQQDGYHLLEASNHEELLEKVNRHLPDLVLLDTVNSTISNVDLCVRIKQNSATQQIPIVIISPKQDVEEKIRALSNGADDYLFRPFHGKELVAKITAIFRGKRMQWETERNMLAKANIELQTVNHKLKNTQAQLVQNEKMVALGQLVAGIAHEINNPLSFVINNSGIFKDTLEDYHRMLDCYSNAKQHIPETKVRQEVEALEQEIDIAFLRAEMPKLLGDVSEGLERIRKIVLDLRNFSRLDEAELKRVNLLEGIESTLNLLAHQIKNQVEVVRDFNELPEVDCYPAQLNQVFMNVLVNAIQASPKGGKITLSTATEAPWAVIRIRDEGKGIPAEVLPRIFEPFFTTKDIGKGTGLGLSISYGIIEKHKGVIEFQSEINKGTTCIIKIPLH